MTGPAPLESDAESPTSKRARVDNIEDINVVPDASSSSTPITEQTGKKVHISKYHGI